jgi:hypothetical protein
MSFDWVHFFEQRGIEFATSGPNVGKGNVAIHCPFCGSGDEAQHLSVNLAGKGWRCWRSPSSHYGRGPTRLVQALLGCSFEQAAAITGSSVHIPEDFLSRVSAALTPAQHAERPPVTMPKQFKPIDVRSPSCRPYVNYLLKRGFPERSIRHMSRDYGMVYASLGPYKGRIIFTVTFEEALVTWTGRAIDASVELRYKALSPDVNKAADEGLPAAIGPTSDYLLWYDDLMQSPCDTIVLVEGPFDALKVSVLGRDVGICSTCFFTSEASPQQVNLLHELLPRFKRRILLLDQGTLPKALKLTNTLSSLNITSQVLSPRFKDPGEIENVSQLLNITLARHE